MKYKGIKLKEFTSDNPVVFDPPRKMLVWEELMKFPTEMEVYAFMPAWKYPVATAGNTFAHCAEIPEDTEEPKPRRATNREFAHWLAKGYGEKTYVEDREPIDDTIYASNEYTYNCSCADDSVPEEFFVRKWDDDEWHEPTVDYMGLEE